MVTVRVARAAVGEVHWFHGSLLLSETPRCRGGYTACFLVFLRTCPFTGAGRIMAWALEALVGEPGTAGIGG